ncbi:hypothetical protein HanIR_Chr07g0330491 [Helianthus annuus]|nr:hypothetical protein HanIR_Chr07g0330491 [Helianthus annuus]
MLTAHTNRLRPKTKLFGQEEGGLRSDRTLNWVLQAAGLLNKRGVNKVGLTLLIIHICLFFYFFKGMVNK